MPYKRVSKKTGRPVWYASAYRGRKRIFVKVGPRKRDAEAVEADLKAKIAKGEYLGIYEEKKITLAEFLPKYLDYSKTHKTERSYERDQISLRALTSGELGGKYLGQINQEDVERYLAQRAQRVKPGTVNKEVATLRHLFTLAVQWKYVSRNPVKGVKLLKEPPGRVRYLLPEQVFRLLQACTMHSAMLKAIVLCALNTGMRQGEILGLLWADVDLEGRTLTLRKTKNNTLRLVPINADLLGVLTALPRPEDPFERVFPEWTRAKCTMAFRRACRRAGIVDFRFHDLRHHAASWMRRRGTDIQTVGAILGHKDLRMTLRYAHLFQEELQEAVNRLEGLTGETSGYTMATIPAGEGDEHS